MMDNKFRKSSTKKTWTVYLSDGLNDIHMASFDKQEDAFRMASELNEVTDLKYDVVETEMTLWEDPGKLHWSLLDDYGTAQ